MKLLHPWRQIRQLQAQLEHAEMKLNACHMAAEGQFHAFKDRIDAYTPALLAIVRLRTNYDKWIVDEKIVAGTQGYRLPVDRNPGGRRTK